MDLPAEAERLRLDVLAVTLSAALGTAQVPHALLKGPSTANWLYDPPRRYRDVDLLVPLSRLEDAVTALSNAGLAARAAGRLGEEAPHSLMLRSNEGFEIDLHVTLPLVTVDGDTVWTVLAPHVVPFVLDRGAVPALDVTARCVVLALHALGHGPSPGQPREDLARARSLCGPGVWDAARALAEELGAGDLVAGGLALVDGDDLTALSRRARLYAAGAPAEALGLARIAGTRGAARWRLIGRELLPSPGFLRFDDPTLPPTRRALVGANLRRWRRLARRLPAGARAYRAVHKAAPRD